MKSLWILVKLYVNSIFRFSVMRRSKDSRERKNAIMGIVAIGIIAVTYGFMSATNAATIFLMNGVSEAPFLLMCTMASVFALVMAFSQGSATLSAFADFDTLMGMPVRTSTVVLARFLALYLVEAVYTLPFLLPCGVVYAIFAKPAFRFYPAYLLMVLLVPVAPLVVGSAADILVGVLFAKSKHKKAITSTIKTVFLLAFVAGAYLMPQLTSRIYADVDGISRTLSRVYPPAQWFAKGAIGSVPLFLLFVFGSLALCALYVWALNRTFLTVHDRLTSGYHVKNYRLMRQRQNSAEKALLSIELRRFFDSTAWVLNTVIGSIMILAVGIAGGIFAERLIGILASIGLERMTAGVLIGVMIFCATLAPTTSSAISMEGKQIWISKQLPIPAAMWLRAKLYVNLLLVGPTLLIATTIFAIAFRSVLNPLDTVGLYLLPLAALLCATVLGLFVNARMPRLNWKTETEVVKQSGAVLIMMLVCFGMVAITLVPVLILRQSWLAIALSALLLIPTAIIYCRLMRDAEQIRLNL